MKRFVSLVLIIVTVVQCAPANDLVKNVPGYPDNYPTKVYSGYLDVKNANRSLHYIFVESIKGANNSDPVTLWLNGGPGCSSLLGFLQEIGPYYLEDGIKYKLGDPLTLNNHSWHRASNLLFLQSPAGVGFSINTQKDYHYSDAGTQMDNYNAVIDFLFSKFPQYKTNRFWIAGQSYAGKYIPDLAVALDKHNEVTTDQKIDFRGIMVGNGVMTFLDGDIEKSQIEYMIDHSFIDPSIQQYWRSSCATDWESAGCRYFNIKYQENVFEINPYNVYGYCYYNDSFDSNRYPRKSQESILLGIIRKTSDRQSNPGMNGAPCAYFDGIFDYFTINDKVFNSKVDKWNGPCADIDYTIDLQGSMDQYRYLIGRINKYVIALYNGDWDNVIPYHDTIKNLRKLDLRPSNQYLPWFTDDQHSGFSHYYSGISFITFKGASHQVPQTKRAAAFDYFNITLNSHVGQTKKQIFTVSQQDIKEE